MFNECTFYLDPDDKLWCSTRTDPSTFEHVNGQGFWGFCTDEYCPIPMSKFLITNSIKIDTLFGNIQKQVIYPFQTKYSLDWDLDQVLVI